MTTHKELREVIDKVAAIKVEGFDNEWVLRAFTRKQALINIKQIKPYTNKYALIVRYLMTGDKTIREEARTAAANAAYAAANDAAAYSAAAYVNAAYSAAAYANAAYVAAADAAYVAANAADVADANASDEAITMIDEMVAEYLAYLQEQKTPVEELTLSQICKELGRDVKVVKE